jgi:two-component system OmpR family response regulator
MHPEKGWIPMTVGKPLRILFVEDDDVVAAELSAAFKREGWIVERTADGADGLKRAAAEPFSVIVLDRMLPGLDGMNVLERLRNYYAVKTPVLVLSAIGEAVDKVAGLETGADDYLGKPFSVEEVLARVRALERRVRPDPHPQCRTWSAFELWKKEKRVLYAGRHVDLAPKEYAILNLLVENEGDTVTRRMILETVFNWRAADDPGTNVVDVHVHRLRVKLTEASGADLIRTVRGTGYRICKPGDDDV